MKWFDLILTWLLGIVTFTVLGCVIWGVYIILSFFFPVMVSI